MNSIPLQSGYVLELLSALPAGTLLCSTNEFEQTTGKQIKHAHVTPIWALIIELDYQEYLTVLSDD